MKDEYSDSKSDLFAAFIERCTRLAGPRGLAAMITMQSWMFLSSYEKLRKTLLSNQQISSMLHLGARAFDSIGGEVVSSTAFVLDNVTPEGRSAGAFIRLVDGNSEAEKMAALSNALESRNKEMGFHLASDADFTVVPGSPIVYWLSEKMRATFSVGRPLGEISTPLVGLRTGDNSRFMRQWWEVSKERSALGCDSLNAAEASGARWFPYNKGGAFRRWYGNHEFVVNWEHDGKEVEEALAIRYPYLVPAGKALVRGQGRNQYFSPAVSWSAITSGNPSFRYYPQGFIPSNAGMACYAQETTLMSVVSIANSAVAEQLLSAIAPTLNLGAGETAKVPMPSRADDGIQARVVALIENSSADWNSAETSWGFVENPLINT